MTASTGEVLFICFMFGLTWSDKIWDQIQVVQANRSRSLIPELHISLANRFGRCTKVAVTRPGCIDQTNHQEKRYTDSEFKGIWISHRRCPYH